jgi:signal transduction histidine kinase
MSDADADFFDLVRRVRHDANNPVTAILGHVHLAMDEIGPENTDLRESLEVIEAEVRRLIEVLRRLDAVRPPSSP